MRRTDDIISLVLVAIVFTFLGIFVHHMVTEGGFSTNTIKAAMPDGN